MSDGCRRLVGSWACRSGNEVDVYLIAGAGARVGEIACEWDCFPLTPEDAADWTALILPEVTTRVAELLERHGPAMVIQT